MTINNYRINPYPTSNPLTSRHIGNNNIMWDQKGFQRCDQNATVPYSKPFSIEDFQVSQSLEVPHQNQIPMGCEGQMSMMPQFNQDLFQCPDGTLISISQRKVIRNSSEDYNSDKIRTIRKDMEY